MSRSDATPDTSRATAIVGTILVLGILHLAREVLIPIACALLLTFVLAPLTRRLQRLGLGRLPAASLMVLFVVLFGAGIAWLVGQQVFDLASNLPRYQENIHEKLSNARQSGGAVFERAGRSFRQIRESLGLDRTAESVRAPASPPPPSIKGQTAPVRPVPVAVIEPPPGVTDVLRSMVGPMLGPLMDVGIVLVFLLFMLVQREDLRDRLIRLIGAGRMSVTTQALDDAARRVSRYLLAFTCVNAAFGTLVAIGLALIGVPNAMLWGLLAGVMRFVPFLGPWIGLSMPLAVSIAVSPGWTMPLMTFALFFVLEVITNSVAEPILYGAGTGISTLAVVVSAAFWAWMWGPVGLILATPLTVCLLVISRYVPHLEFIEVLLGDERALPAEAHFYQRLLAMDQVEAAEIVDGFLRERPVVELYDSVVVPALALAEHDRHQGGLSDERQSFIVQSVRDLVDDLSERQPEPAAWRPGRVVCLPARDDADAAAARMLAQLIEAQGATAAALSPELLSGEMLDAIARDHADAIVISAIPPYAVMYATYLCKRVRRRFPDTPVVVGLWNTPGETSPAYKRLQGVCGDRVATSLAQALAQVLEIIPEAGEVAVTAVEPTDEEDRLRDVQALGLLDTDPEPAFERIVEELSRALSMPVAMIALVNGDREWWKAHRGLPDDLAKARGAARASSMAARVVAEGALVMVPDTRRDPRAAGSELVRATGARFYAGAPLKAESGRVIGALCVMDRRPRHLSTSEKHMLEMVADAVMAQIKLRAALGRAADAEGKLEGKRPEEVADAARKLQRRILPATAVIAGGCSVSHLHRDTSAGAIGFLDVLVREDGSIVLGLADSVAEPATALVLAATLKTSFARAAPGGGSALDILRALEEDLARVAQRGDLVSATIALIVPEARTVAIALAGHAPPIRLLSGPAVPAELPRTDPLFSTGRGSNTPPSPVSAELTLEPGERLLFAGDGAHEAEDESGGLLGQRGLVKLASGLDRASGEAFLRALAEAIDERNGRAPRSDLVLALAEWPDA